MRLLFLAAALLAGSQTVFAAPWRAEVVYTDHRVEEAAINEDAKSIFRAGRHWLTMSIGDRDVCALPDRTWPDRIRAPKASGLPDGFTAYFGEGEKVWRAWYEMPTDRYRHGILGDRIEAGSLKLVLPGGGEVSLVLPESRVFEDLTPRLVDLDSDGTPEVITILADRNLGASLAIYRLDGETLKQDVSTGFIGTANRWLNPIGHGDLTGDGTIEIALIRTPHIGGILEIWRYAPGKLEQVLSEFGFSNHAIGSRVLEMHALEDMNFDGVDDIVVPSVDRGSLRIVSFAGGRLRDIAEFEVPGTIVSRLAVERRPDGDPVVVFVNDRGKLIAAHKGGSVKAGKIRKGCPG